MGEDRNAHAKEVASLRLGIELGLTLIDTAEMYGEGGAEKVVADAIEGQRDRVFIVTKVYPHNASHKKMPEACERSLKRLRVDVVDLYLLHWREDTPPLSESVEAFEQLRAAGKIRRWGVSNFDVDDMEELVGLPCSANQVLYNIEARGIEFDLLPWSRRHKIPIMAYAPVGHGRGLLNHPSLKKIAQRHDATSAQIALAWVLRQPDVIAIPKASKRSARPRERGFARDSINGTRSRGDRSRFSTAQGEATAGDVVTSPTRRMNRRPRPFSMGPRS
jgi:diketogulonate reductase-like aldo/keto reductase